MGKDKKDDFAAQVAKNTLIVATHIANGLRMDAAVATAKDGKKK